jgi:hypothetical protein
MHRGLPAARREEFKRNTREVQPKAGMQTVGFFSFVHSLTWQRFIEILILTLDWQLRRYNPCLPGVYILTQRRKSAMEDTAKELKQHWNRE